MRLLDTSVLIEHLRGTPPAVALVRDAAIQGDGAVSVLSRVEVEGTMRSKERSTVSRMFSALSMEPVSDLIAARAGELARRYRASHVGIDLVDFVIAATAEHREAELLTLNVKHFPMFRGLKPAF